MKLTAKQDKFCYEYMTDLNATQAAKRAGYSLKTAGKIGQENLSKPAIQARLRELQAETQKRIKITIDDVVERINYIAIEGSDDSIRLKANDMLMKHLGGYSADHSQKVEQNVTVYERVERVKDSG